MCRLSGLVLHIYKQKRQSTAYKTHQNDESWIDLSETDKGEIKSKSFLRIDKCRQIKQ